MGSGCWGLPPTARAAVRARAEWLQGGCGTTIRNVSERGIYKFLATVSTEPCTRRNQTADSDLQIPAHRYPGRSLTQRRRQRVRVMVVADPRRMESTAIRCLASAITSWAAISSGASDMNCNSLSSQSAPIEGCSAPGPTTVGTLSKTVKII